MKASLKLKDDSNPPLLRLKVPLNILGFPFQSGVSACGDHKDLSLNLATLFDSGPSVKLAYKPNDSWNPFSLVVKTGVGSYGSTLSSPLSISAEFNLLSRGNPNFVLRFTPRFGDFGLKKLTRSGSVLKDLEKIEKSKLSNGNGNGGVLGSVVGNGVEVSATSVLPIRKRAVVKFNWGVKIPVDEDVSGWNIGNLGKIPPFLVMNKISIEHVAGGDLKKKKAADVAEKEIGEVCFGMKRELDMLHAENGILRRSVEEIKSEIVGGGKFDSTEFVRQKNCRKAPEVVRRVEVEGLNKGFNTSSNTSI